MPRHRRPPHTAAPHTRTRRGARPPLAVAAVSLGCPKNLVDTEVMLGHMTQAGYTLTSEPAEAEILVVNTCGFIDQAKQESVDTILEMATHKKKGRARRLIVAGCLVEHYRGEIQDSLPEEVEIYQNYHALIIRSQKTLAGARMRVVELN